MAQLEYVAGCNLIGVNKLYGCAIMMQHVGCTQAEEEPQERRCLGHVSLGTTGDTVGWAPEAVSERAKQSAWWAGWADQQQYAECRGDAGESRLGNIIMFGGSQSGYCVRGMSRVLRFRT